jgi:hypothetical protein
MSANYEPPHYATVHKKDKKVLKYRISLLSFSEKPRNPFSTNPTASTPNGPRAIVIFPFLPFAKFYFSFFPWRVFLSHYFFELLIWHGGLSGMPWAILLRYWWRREEHGTWHPTSPRTEGEMSYESVWRGTLADLMAEVCRSCKKSQPEAKRFYWLHDHRHKSIQRIRRAYRKHGDSWNIGTRLPCLWNSI